MPVSGNLLLDTNIVIGLFKEDAVILKHVAESKQLWISAVVLGELYFGAFNSARVAANIKQIRDFEQSITVLPITEKTSAHYGEIKAGLKSQGTPIPENDIWIAASAKEHDMIVVTRDNHLQCVKMIQTVMW